MDEQIVMGVASQPHRVDTLELAIRSVIDQVDVLNVFLNGYEDTPRFLITPSDYISQSQINKIEVFRSQEHGDLGALGKHFTPNEIRGYRFTIDDDILYPPDYVETLIQKIERYRRRCLVGVHGATLQFPIQSFIRSRHTIAFELPMESDQFVHMLGCGTLAYHTDTFNFSHQGHAWRDMDDIQVAVQAQLEQVGMVCVARRQKWLVNIDRCYSKSIFSRLKGRDGRHTKLLRSVDWSIHGQKRADEDRLDRKTSVTPSPLQACTHRDPKPVAPGEHLCASPHVFARTINGQICETCAWRSVGPKSGEELPALPNRPMKPGRRITSWAVGVTTAPRRAPTLARCLRSLREAGWATPQIFAEPNAEVSLEARRLKLSRRQMTLGAFPNWYLTLAELFMGDPRADAYMVCQDDAIFSRGLRDYLEQTLWPAPDAGVVSPYRASHYRNAPRDGFYESHLGWDTWGALCYLFSNQSVRRFLSDPFVLDHRHHGPNGGTRNIDSVVGAWCQRNERPLFLHSPSLVQHIGETSTIYPHARSVGARRASSMPATVDKLKNVKGSTDVGVVARGSVSKPPAVGILSPCWSVGGVERWWVTLLRGTRGLNWSGLAVIEGGVIDTNMVQETVDAGCPFLGHGSEAIERLKETSDTIVIWGHEGNPLRDFGGRIIWVAHGSSDYTARMAATHAPWSNEIVAVSEAAASVVPYSYAHKTTIIHHGVDLTRLRPSKCRSELHRDWNVRASFPRIGFVGRWSEEKRPLAAAHLVAATPRATAVYCSHSRSEDWRSEVCRVTQGQCVFVESDRAADVYQGVDLVVAPSEYEGWGLVWAECWATGTPLVANRCEGVIPEAEKLAGGHLCYEFDELNPQSCLAAMWDFEMQLRGLAIVDDYYSTHTMGHRWSRFLLRRQNASDAPSEFALDGTTIFEHISATADR